MKEFMKTLPVQFVDYLNTLGLKLILKINDYHIDSDGKKMPHGTYTNSNNTITVTDSDSYELLYHEFVHAVQDDLNISSTDFAIGNSNLEYEAYIMGQFIKDMYAVKDEKILKLYFDSEGLVALDIKATIDILKKDSLSGCIFFF